MGKRQITYVIAAMLLACVLAMAQQEKKPLTNADVVTLIKAGLPDDTIILAIQQSPSNFDTSPEGLIQLKNQGATPKILDAILQAGTGRAAAPNESAESSAMPRAGMRTGVIMIDGSKETEMKYNSHNLRSSGYNPVPFSSTKLRAAFDGSHAELRTTNTSPVFELSVAANAQPSDQITVISLTVKDDRREIALAKVSGMTGSVSTGFPKDRVIPIIIEEVQSQGRSGRGSYTRYRVKLVNPMSAGEYALVVGRSYYDFGVDISR